MRLLLILNCLLKLRLSDGIMFLREPCFASLGGVAACAFHAPATLNHGAKMPLPASIFTCGIMFLREPCFASLGGVAACAFHSPAPLNHGAKMPLPASIFVCGIMFLREQTKFFCKYYILTYFMEVEKNGRSYQSGSSND